MNPGASYLASGYSKFDELLDKPDRYVMSRVMLGKPADDAQSQASRDERRELLAQYYR